MLLGTSERHFIGHHMAPGVRKLGEIKEKYNTKPVNRVYATNITGAEWEDDLIKLLVLGDSIFCKSILVL